LILLILYISASYCYFLRFYSWSNSWLWLFFMASICSSNSFLIYSIYSLFYWGCAESTEVDKDCLMIGFLVVIMGLGSKVSTELMLVLS
jgi:hypothetical protein